MAEVVLEDVVKEYGDVRAVDHVSMTIRDGEFVAYEPIENDHRDHILHHSRVPAAISQARASVIFTPSRSSMKSPISENSTACARR